ncbi:MAG: L,D-transpeptidase family protein [Butyricicoccus sp.]|nr:L,D-transpeptidase family protein [Butyricicoccus sp.]
MFHNQLKRIVAVLCAGSLLWSSAAAATITDFPDAAGHWAYDALAKAVDDGLLQGDEGRLLPSGSLTGAQMAAILNRVLEAQNTDRSYPDTPAGQWYTQDASKAASLGTLPVDGSIDLNAPVTRGQVFAALTAAFGLDEASPDESVLDAFSDANTLTPAQRRAAAVLVRDGILSGSEDGSLQASRGITRAEFVSLIYRIWNSSYLTTSDMLAEPEPPAEDVTETPTDETVETPTDDTAETPADNTAETPADETAEAPAADTAETPADETAEAPAADTTETPADETTEAPAADTAETPVAETKLSPVYLFYTSPDSLDRTQSYDRIVLRGQDMAPVFSEGDPISVKRLVIGTTGTPFTLSNTIGNTFGTVVIGGGTGAVTVQQNTTNRVEITGSDRAIYLTGLKLDSLIISGSGNKIFTDSQTSIGTLRVTAGASNNVIQVDGSVNSADLAGAWTTLQGDGHAGNVFVTGKRCTISLAADTVDDSKVDNGLDGVKVTVTAPKVAPGGQITATATITGVDKARICGAQWYLDGQPESSFANWSFEISEGKTSSYRRAITFTKNMQLEHTVGFVLTYRNSVTGDYEKIIAGATVTIENYPASHYLPTPAEVLAKVNPTYRPGNTDYSDDEKTVFVNAKGYASDTQYLIWVSRSAQMVNVFQGSKGNWKLIHEFQCATGKSSSPTPVGVTYVTYKQTAWVTSSYTCRPIVRFYPGTGYAFHSRLYYPGTNTLKDPSIGFPVSAGCVRMLDEGINWLYNNIPSKTTVVIY